MEIVNFNFIKKKDFMEVDKLGGQQIALASSNAGLGPFISDLVRTRTGHLLLNVKEPV